LPWWFLERVTHEHTPAGAALVFHDRRGECETLIKVSRNLVPRHGGSLPKRPFWVDETRHLASYTTPDQ
jgi:hypothetical protein